MGLVIVMKMTATTTMMMTTVMMVMATMMTMMVTVMMMVVMTKMMVVMTMMVVVMVASALQLMVVSSVHLVFFLAQAVKEALHVPVIGNGNIRNKKDADDLMAYTGVDGVMSAEALLENPALYSKKHDPSR